MQSKLVFNILFQYHWTITFGIILELVFIILVFLFYFEPETLKQLKIYPEDLFKDGIKKYPDVDEDVNDFIELMQQNVSVEQMEIQHLFII